MSAQATAAAAAAAREAAKDDLVVSIAVSRSRRLPASKAKKVIRSSLVARRFNNDLPALATNQLPICTAWVPIINQHKKEDDPELRYIPYL